MTFQDGKILELEFISNGDVFGDVKDLYSWILGPPSRRADVVYVPFNGNKDSEIKNLLIHGTDTNKEIFDKFDQWMKMPNPRDGTRTLLETAALRIERGDKNTEWLCSVEWGFIINDDGL